MDHPFLSFVHEVLAKRRILSVNSAKEALQPVGNSAIFGRLSGLFITSGATTRLPFGGSR
jgi:hypothetical protein